MPQQQSCYHSYPMLVCRHRNRFSNSDTGPPSRSVSAKATKQRKGKSTQHHRLYIARYRDAALMSNIVQKDECDAGVLLETMRQLCKKKTQNPETMGFIFLRCP